MLSVDHALSEIYSAIERLQPRRLPLADALGLVLAEEVIASEDLLPFANSAMDGYAVASKDTAGATAEAPRALKVTQEVPAGRWPRSPLAAGCAAKIMTGAPLPEGADAIVRVEWTERRENGIVLVKRSVAPGDDVRPAGEDVRRGERVLRQGTLLRPAEIAMLAALGHPDVLVFPRPRVAILTTGSELVEPGEAVPPGHIRDSNRYSLAAQILWCGGTVGPSFHVPDEPLPVEQALRQCAETDLIITSGGVSVGDFDLVKEVLARLGRIRFWKVAIRPGKPLVFGEINGRPLFGLPGNPVSSMVAFEVFVRPAIDRMRGVPPRPHLRGRLAQPVAHKPGRRTYLRAAVTQEDGVLMIYPAQAQGSGQISSLVKANALVIIPESTEVVGIGEWAEIIPLWDSFPVLEQARKGIREGRKGAPNAVPVISIVGRKKAGKTTLVEALVRCLTGRGYRVGTVKHDAHDFQIDHEGKDSWRHAKAGAVSVAVASASRYALIKEMPEVPLLEDLIAQHFQDVDIVITEGYSQGPAPKIEVRREGAEPLCKTEETIAVVGAAAGCSAVPRFAPDEVTKVADYIEERFLKVGNCP